MYSPVDLAGVLKETQPDRVDRCITPSFVEETTCAVKVIEVLFIFLASEKVHVTDLEVRPEVAGRVTIGRLSMVGA